MSIFDTRISSFKNTRATEVENRKGTTVRDWLNRIEDGIYKNTIDRLREGDESAKLELPTVAFHGVFGGYRKKNDFIEASGLIILDIDDVEVEDIEETKHEIMDENSSVVAVMTSPSGDGIKILYYIQPDLVTADTYRQIGKQLVSDFEVYGKVDYLSVTDCLIMTYDPNILINEDAIPGMLFIKEVVQRKVELEKLDETKVLWDDPEDFFDTVLANDIESKTANNFHYIQVAIFDLAKFGFTHPKEDLSFVIDYAESAFKSSPDNKKRFMEAVEVAKQYPQSLYPYKVLKDEEDDDFNDYSEFMDSDAISNKKKTIEGEESEVEGDGLVDYSLLFDSVIEVVKEGDRVGFEVSQKSFANIFRFKGTGILTVTGIPGHGKTEFLDSCILDLARLYDHETIICGYEQTPEEHIIKLIRKLVGKNVTCPSYFNESNMPEFKEAYEFVTSKIKHINTNKTGGNVNEILEIAAKQVKKSRDGGGDPKYLLLDPFNMLSIKGKFSGHEKIEEILRRLTHFSHQMGVMVILVAHPFKMRIDEKTGAYFIPDFYSVKGSSAFFEMSYHGLVIYRTGYQPNDPVQVKVLKVKQNNLGVTGEMAYFAYEKASGRYVPLDSEGNEESGDHRDKDWLDKANNK